MAHMGKRWLDDDDDDIVTFKYRSAALIELTINYIVGPLFGDKWTMAWLWKTQVQIPSPQLWIHWVAT